MHCPKCKVKVMTDAHPAGTDTPVRCIKCGAEFTLTKGRLKQKKIKRTKRCTKKIIVSSLPTQATRKPNDPQAVLKQHKHIQEQVKQVRRLNEQAKRVRR